MSFNDTKRIKHFGFTMKESEIYFIFNFTVSYLLYNNEGLEIVWANHELA